uniref:NADH dehydrogenase [ubiquinone] 1 alpha subcomplex subunit 11 n=1 Tax=Clastoptera arizonana TaxID=38151 RepID=A0A1B6BZ96_9HEMI
MGYHDSPDGEDCVKKLAIATKNAAKYGLFAAALEVLTISHPKGAGAIAARLGYITLPFVGVAATFVTTSCLLTDLRKKDDYLNYIIGGFLSGTVVGAWAKNGHTGFATGLLFAAAAFAYKDSMLNNYKMFNLETNPVFGDFRSIKNKDTFSFLGDYPHSWKKE